MHANGVYFLEVAFLLDNSLLSREMGLFIILAMLLVITRGSPGSPGELDKINVHFL